MKAKKTLTYVSLLLMFCFSFLLCSTTTVEAAKIKLNKKTLKMYTGTGKYLKLKGITKQQEKKVKWVSSKKNIVKVHKDGWLWAKKKGTAVITAKYKGRKYKCKVYVKKAPNYNSKVTARIKKLTIAAGSSKSVWVDTNRGKQLSATCSDNLSISWGKWKNTACKLKIKALSTGTGKVVVYDSHKKSIKTTITVTVPEDYTDATYVLAGLGINNAYRSTKFPSTLHIRSIKKRNGYWGVLLECYAMNELGGYSTFYSYAYEGTDGLYHSATYSDTAYIYDIISECTTKLDAKKALLYYQHYYNTTVNIPFDNY